MAGLFARWVFVWNSGLGLGGMANKKRIQLGEDDAESVWLVLTEKYLANSIQGTEIYVGDVRMPVGFSETAQEDERGGSDGN